MPMMGRPWRMSGVLAVAAVWSFTASPSGAIVVDLDPAAVKQAIEGGKKMTDEDLKTIPTRFGANLKEDLCGGGGEIRTKTVTLNRLGGAVARNPEQAEEDKAKIDEHIQKILDSKVLRIAFDFCGDTSDFAEGSSATSGQGANIIKGGIANADSGRYHHKV